MKGPSEKGDQFAVLEYMKSGQVVTHPCAPLSKIEFFIRSPSPSPEPDTPPIPPTVAEVPHEPEVSPRPSCVCMHLVMWAEVKGHSYHARAHVCVGSCIYCA